MLKQQAPNYFLILNVAEEVDELYRQLSLNFDDTVQVPTQEEFLLFLNQRPKSLYYALAEGEVHEEVFDRLLSDYTEFRHEHAHP